MRRGIITTAILLLYGAGTAFAGGKDGRQRESRDMPLFTFGVESSYVLTFLNFSHFNFISADGDRRDLRASTSGALSNGQLLVGGGVNMSANWNLSLYTGYCGVYDNERLIPLTARLTWLSGDSPMKGRWLVFLGGGIGFNNLEKPENISVLGKIGAGRRVSLNRSVKLDFLIGLQETYTHPRAYESDVGNYVPAERLRRNDAFISAVTFGLALVF